MKSWAILVISMIGLVTADSYGQYVPKAYFTIDGNGNPSPVQSINANSLNRARRQVQPFGNQGFGFQAFPQFPIPQAGQGQGSFVSSSQTLNSRFGDDEPQVSGQSTVIHKDHKGNYHQTNTYTRPDGSVHTNKHSGRVKRQQNQIQSQDGGQGGNLNQLQSQSQNQPGGQQSQTQSQGNNPQNIPQQGNQQNIQPQQGNIQPQQGNQYDQNNQGVQQNAIPQGNQQYAPNENDNRNQQSYPQPNYQQGFGNSPFGFGGFGQQGFPQFGQGVGFGPQGAGFGAPAGFPFATLPFGQFPAPIQPQPGPGAQTSFTGSTQTLDNRFGEEEKPIVTGGTQTITSHNGHFHHTSSILKPNGQVVTSEQSGKVPEKKN